MPTIAKPEQLPSGRWRIRFKDQAGIRRTEILDTFVQATAALDQYRTAVRGGSYRAPTDDITLADWYREFSPTEGYLRVATQCRYEISWRLHVEPRWGSSKLRTITRLEVEHWIADMLRSGAAPGTVEKNYRTFSRLLRAALDHDRLDRLPLPPKSRIPTDKRKMVRFLDNDEVYRLADAIDPRYRALILVGCYTGLRIRELLALRMCDLDLRDKFVAVTRTQVDIGGQLSYNTPKSKAGVRTVPLPDPVLDELMVHIDRLDVPDMVTLVFQAPEGGVMRLENLRNRLFNPAVTKSGLAPFTPHDMRHTAASLFISEKATMLEVAYLLGHADTRMIDRVYGHLFAKDREALRLRLSARAVPPTTGNVVPLRKAL